LEAVVNRAERLRRVLADGKPHTRRDIFDRAGFMLTNNAASELRAQGETVVQWRDRGEYLYRLEPQEALFDDAA